MRDMQREREAETQAEGEAGSMQGDRRGTRSLVSRITPWAEGGAKPLSHPDCPILKLSNLYPCYVFFFFFSVAILKLLLLLLLRFYLFIHERHREREAETQAEGGAGSMQGDQCGTRSRVSKITPWAAGGAKPLSHPDCPTLHPFFGGLDPLFGGTANRSVWAASFYF